MQSDTIYFFFLCKSALYLLRGVDQSMACHQKLTKKGRDQDLAVFYEIQVWYWHVSPTFSYLVFGFHILTYITGL